LSITKYCPIDTLKSWVYYIFSHSFIDFSLFRSLWKDVIEREVEIRCWSCSFEISDPDLTLINTIDRATGIKLELHFAEGTNPNIDFDIVGFFHISFSHFLILIIEKNNLIDDKYLLKITLAFKVSSSKTWSVVSFQFNSPWFENVIWNDWPYYFYSADVWHIRGMWYFYFIRFFWNSYIVH